MQSKGSRIESQVASRLFASNDATAGGLPEERQRAHLVGPPSVEEFHAAVRRHRKAALTLKRSETPHAMPYASLQAAKYERC
jgi:hypothetical protein